MRSPSRRRPATSANVAGGARNVGSLSFSKPSALCSGADGSTPRDPRRRELVLEQLLAVQVGSSAAREGERQVVRVERAGLERLRPTVDGDDGDVERRAGSRVFSSAEPIERVGVGDGRVPLALPDPGGDRRLSAEGDPERARRLLDPPDDGPGEHPWQCHAPVPLARRPHVVSHLAPVRPRHGAWAFSAPSGTAPGPPFSGSDAAAPGSPSESQQPHGVAGARGHARADSARAPSDSTVHERRQAWRP